MDSGALRAVLKGLGIEAANQYREEAFSRNIGLLTKEEQAALAEARVAIPGMGGVGGVHFITLVRSGVGKFHVSDFDTFEPANINRQFGARVTTFGRSKLDVMVEMALEINPFLEIETFPEGISPENVDPFLEGVQVVLDGLDFFNFDIRRLVFNRAREKGAYVITAGPLGFSSAMLIFSPHEGMGFDEYFDVTDETPEEEKYMKFGMGLAPRGTHIRYMDLSRVDLKGKAGPSLNTACQVCTGMAATEALRILLKRGTPKPVPFFSQFDPYRRLFRKGKLRGGNRNPIQRTKMWIVKKFLLVRKPQSTPALPVMRGGDMTPGKIPKDAASYLLEAAIRAPSGDNAQPWAFSCEGDTIRVYLDEEADRSFFNVRQVASIISCGAVIENISVAASALGFAARISYVPEPGLPTLMAAIRLEPGQNAPDPLNEALWTRYTNRKFFDRRPLDQGILEAAGAAADSIEGARLHVVTELKDRKRLGSVIYRADRIRTEHRPLHEHLMKMIRFTDEEAEEKRDGFPLKNLEAGLAGEWFLRFARPWAVMRIMNAMGAARMVAHHSRKALRSAPAAALVTVPGTRTEDFLKGGRALQRVWLTLTRQGLCFQPMTAITLFRTRWQLEGPDAFSRRHQRLLKGVWRDYRDIFKGVDFSKEGHVMLFRMGYAKDIRYYTHRKKVSDFLVPDGPGRNQEEI